MQANVHLEVATLAQEGPQGHIDLYFKMRVRGLRCGVPWGSKSQQQQSSIIVATTIVTTTAIVAATIATATVTPATAATYWDCHSRCNCHCHCY